MFKFRLNLQQNNSLCAQKKRTIIPKYNNNIGSGINSNRNVNKTIVHIFNDNCQSGIGDYLRGSMLLAEYAKYFNINFKLDVSNHKISKYLDLEQESVLSQGQIHSFFFNRENSNESLKNMIMMFTRSNETTLYIKTNLFYNINLLTEDTKNYINDFFKFKQIYYDIAKKEFCLDKGSYKVLHIRCKDDTFDTEFSDNILFGEIIKLQLNENTIVLSNNNSFKKKINELFGFHFIDNMAFHSAKIKNHTDLESTIIDYIILSNSCHNYCFSYYQHGSGFSEQCSVLNNVPYNMFFLSNAYLSDKKIIEENNNLLSVHTTNLLQQNIITNGLINTEHIEKTDYSNIEFVTLTNTGYVNYTLNCLESLKRINMKKLLKVYCIGEEGYAILKQNEVTCELIHDDNAVGFQEFRKKNWSNVVYYKFEIIHENLLKNEYVCITDGDIVYENNIVFDYLLNNIQDNDLLIQSEGITIHDVCSGFMFIKSNENTISLFNPKNIEKYINTVGWDDQVYVNSIKDKLKYKKLPLSLFPTGKYYYEYNNKSPYLIHFNWIIGHEKKKRMIQYNKWYLSDK